MLRNNIFDEHIAARNGGAHHIAAGLYLVRNDGIGAAMHAPHAVHLDDVCACAAHVGAHGVQEVCHVHDVRLFGNVLQHGEAVCHYGGQHGVDGGAHRNRVEENFFPAQCRRRHGNHAVIHHVLRAKGREGFQMLVDGARAQITPAGHGHSARAEAPQQRAQKIIGSAHLAAELVRHTGGVDMGGIYFCRVLVQHAHAGAHGAENVQRSRHVADTGQVFNDALVRSQNGGRQNSYGSIFCPADGHFSYQRPAAANDKFLHVPITPLPSIARPGRASLFTQLL